MEKNRLYVPKIAIPQKPEQEVPGMLFWLSGRNGALLVIRNSGVLKRAKARIACSITESMMHVG
jgi:hypothetical protein